MSVRNCAFPWHWILVTAEGDVMPCSYGSRPIGNLRNQSLEEIWNGPVIQDLRRSILADEVHPLCQCRGCPFQRSDPAYPEPSVPLEVDAELAEGFDDAWYLSRHPDVGEAVASGALSSGLEHFIRHGKAENRAHQNKADPGDAGKSPSEGSSTDDHARPDNAVLALLEFSMRQTVVTSFPSDIALVVTNICNLQCMMCPQGMNEVRNPQHTPVEIVTKALKFLLRAQRVILSGIGEPLLSPAFWSVVESLKRKPFGLLRIHSNAHFLTSTNVDRVLHSGLNLLLVSLDAAQAETYRQIRGSDFARPLAGIRTLIQARDRHSDSKLRVGVTMTLMKDNVSEATAFVRLAKVLAVDTAIFSQLFAFGDRPDWVIERERDAFVYSDQMPGKMREQVTVHLNEALREAEALGVKVILHDNVGSYV